MDPIAEQALVLLQEAWPGLARLLLAWARIAPIVLLVPAFGLRALTAPIRIALGLAMAVAVAPGLELEGGVPSLTPYRLAGEALRTLPIAFTAAAALHVATMAGGLVDTLRGDRANALLPNLPEGSSPIGTLLGILVAILFLEGGGAVELARLAMTAGEPERTAFVGAAAALAGGIGLAVAVAMPLVVVAIVIEVAFALTARAANPAHVAAVLAPARSLILLGATAIVLDRLVALLGVIAQSGTR